MVNVGRDYYQQCFELKKKKRQELLPGLNSEARKRQPILLPSDRRWGNSLLSVKPKKKKSQERKNEQTPAEGEAYRSEEKKEVLPNAGCL